MNPADIVKQWQDLYTVFDPKIGWGDLHTLNEHIKLAMSLDESNLTTLLVIDNAVEDYISSRNIHLGEVLKDPARFNNLLSIYTSLFQNLHHKDIEDATNSFIGLIKKAIRGAGWYKPELDKFFANRYAFAEIRLAALHSFKTLRVDQFAIGENTTVGKLNIVNDIYEFRDVNLMLSAMRSFPDGMFLTLIRDIVDDHFSFFTFVIRNGGNLYLISDKPELPSPNYKHTGRSKSIERGFEGRVYSHYFPYDLMGVAYDSDAEKLVILTDYSKALREYKDNWRAVGKISDCEAETIAWLFMVMSLMQNRFYGAVPFSKQLSYTAAMIDLPKNADNVNALTTTTGAGLLKYEPLPMFKITLAILTNKNPDIKKIWEYKPTGKNEWIEKRYGPQVPEDAVNNPIALPGMSIMLVSNDNKILTADQIKYYNELDFFDKMDMRIDRVPAMELNDFGTEEEVTRDLIWNARNAKVNAMGNLMMDEYHAEKENIEKWYDGMVRKNYPALRQAIAKGEFKSVVSRLSRTRAFDSEEAQGNILHFYTTKDNTPVFGGVRIYGKYSRDYPYYWCVETGAVASYVAVFRVDDGTTIADMCGVPLKDLPDYLQNLKYIEEYSGNSILNTVDPLEGLENPWKKVEWSIRVFLSKRGYNNLCKEFGTEPKEIKSAKDK
jgi:hypothetical protein